jgi:hypothetical protein
MVSKRGQGGRIAYYRKLIQHLFHVNSAGERTPYLEVYSNASGPQVVNPEDGTYNVPGVIV